VIGKPRRHEVALTMAVTTAAPVALLALWFVIPLGGVGPDNPALSWLAFVAALAGLAVVLLREIRRELLGLPGKPGLVIILLICTTLVVFATAYLGLSHNPGELNGISTKIDALYFTVITMSTVGYGDIVPVGQAARIVVMLQILYTLVFLTAGGTALTRRMRANIHERAIRQRPPT